MEMVALGIGILAVAGVVMTILLRPRLRESRLTSQRLQGRNTFAAARQGLETRFFTLSAQSGRPRGLSWLHCDFDETATFARDTNSGELRALVGMTIQFQAIAGGEMEDNPNASNLRAATAVFSFEAGQWSTAGRTIFNLNPVETITHFKHELQALEEAEETDG